MKKYKVYDLIPVVGLLAVIYGFSIATLATPDKDFSPDENRYLQKKPTLTFESLDSGKFTKGVADYFSDQIPLRSLFVETKAVAELALGKQANDGVLYGKDGYIIAYDLNPDLDEARKNIKALNRFGSALPENIDFRVAVAGRVQDVMYDKMPSLYPGEAQTWRVFWYLDSNLTEDKIDLLTPLQAHSDEYIYYRTDHHWTTLGAYYAYCEIMRDYGIEPCPIEHFTRETVSGDFYGTTWSKAGTRWVAPDSMEYFRFDGDTGYKVIIDGGETLSGFYDTKYLDEKDKYSSFIGGNNGHVTITSGKAGRETLILIKDSFGHSLAPFLAEHFDLEILDLRYFKTSAYEFVVNSGASKVLFLCNMDSMINSNSTAMLNIGIKN